MRGWFGGEGKREGRMKVTDYGVGRSSGSDVACVFFPERRREGAQPEKRDREREIERERPRQRAQSDDVSLSELTSLSEGQHEAIREEARRIRIARTKSNEYQFQNICMDEG